MKKIKSIDIEEDIPERVLFDVGMGARLVRAEKRKQAYDEASFFGKILIFVKEAGEIILFPVIFLCYLPVIIWEYIKPHFKNNVKKKRKLV